MDGGVDGGTDAGVVAACANAEALRASCDKVLADKFEQSTVLAKGCYRAKQTPRIDDGVTLTLSPGVTILFDEEAGLELSGAQSLVASGTEQEPICLTGAQPKRGAWNGLTLGRTEAVEDRLEPGFRST